MNWWSPTHADVATDGTLRVLIIEDSEDDTVLLLRELSQGDYSLRWRRVDTRDELIDALSRQVWDIILSDHSMPSFSGVAALAVVRERGLDVPFIFVSATIGEDTAVMAMKAGAQDYIMKGNLKRLLPAVARELGEAKIRADGISPASCMTRSGRRSRRFRSIWTRSYATTRRARVRD